MTDASAPADSIARPLLRRAIAAARRSLAYVGVAPADGAARARPTGIEVRAGQARGWCGAPLLAGPGTHLAVATEPAPQSVEAIRAAGVTHVCVGVRDPRPEARGFVERAAAAGLAVTVADDPRMHDLHAIFRRAAQGRAYVVLKVATSLDGRLATRTGDSQWITGPAARAVGRRMRGRLSAILVGVQTVLADDPQLTARRAGDVDPLRVVLDSRLRTPVDARVVTTARQTPTAVLTTDAASPAAARDLERAGVRVVALPADAAGRVSVDAVTAWLASEGRPSVLVEGGGVVHGAFVDAGLVDRVMWFGAPLLLGGQARAAVGGQGPARLRDALRFSRWVFRRVGPDYLLDAVREDPADDRLGG